MRCRIEPFAWFSDVLSRIAAHPVNRLAELLPHNVSMRVFVPLVEAMLLRVPIVAWARTGVGETVGNAGLVWGEDDPDLLAESLAAVLESSSLRRTLVEWGFRRYREHFAIARIEQRFLAMVEGLLSSTQDYRKIHT